MQAKILGLNIKYWQKKAPNSTAMKIGIEMQFGFHFCFIDF